MRNLAILLTVAACSVISFAGNAQIKTGKLNGIIKDVTGKTVSNATVTLLTAKDSSMVKVGVAGKDGRYGFENIAYGRYLVSVTATEHAKNFSPVFEISEGTPDISLKTIEMATRVKSLNAVTVTAKRPLIEQKIDRTIVNVEASITNTGTNALEVLEKSPGISVDKDGNISLKGKDGVIVLVDGRQTYLSGPDLANYLRNLNASQMDQIEIMTNPPAKYDASGNSGIINIKTKKIRQLGYNGSINFGYGQGRYPKFNEGLNLNYRKNKLNLFTNLSHNYSHNFNTLSIQRNFRHKETKDLLSHFDQEARNENISKNYNAKLGLDYFARKNTTLGIVFNGFLNDRNGNNRNLTDISDASGNLASQTRATLNNTQEWKNFSTNFNLRQVLDTLGSELTADLDYSQYSSENNPVMINSYFDQNGISTYQPDTLLGALPQNIKIYSGRIDYIKSLKKGARFEAGLKSSYVKTDNDAAYDSVLNGQLVHDFNRSNYFIYEENINAGYVNLNQPIDKKWGAQLGLRLENTNAKGYQVTTGEQFNRHYTQLFPTAYLQYQHDKKNTYVLNYGRRIRRPDYQSLNPFINFIDRYTYSKGNPNLKPQFSHNIEVSHSYQSFLTTTLNYSRTTDIIQNVLEQNEAKNETFVRKANIANQRQFGISFNTNVPVAKWWRSNVYVNAFNSKFEGIVNDTFVTISATTLTLNGSQQFNFAKTWSAEISGFFRTGGIEGVIRARPMGMMSLGVSKQVMKNKGTLRLNIRDVFYTQRFRGVSKYGNVDAAFQERGDSRVVNINFAYRFSKGKINGTPKRRAGSASEEQNRVGG
ncbi:MAG: TonB-dependent receptor [Chitinophagaceae bacterium]|nr:TonB-dependent receptor [Chitinophagaceae bacterium]